MNNEYQSQELDEELIRKKLLRDKKIDMDLKILFDMTVEAVGQLLELEAELKREFKENSLWNLVSKNGLKEFMKSSSYMGRLLVLEKSKKREINDLMGTISQVKSGILRLAEMVETDEHKNMVRKIERELVKVRRVNLNKYIMPDLGEF